MTYLADKKPYTLIPLAVKARLMMQKIVDKILAVFCKKPIVEAGTYCQPMRYASQQKHRL